ncbi:hypothetical protein HK099_002049 [Clydaea vesicula]|uniref:S-methyl-5'-thioadenosine phosphorylase n=1 Tax=Clydaea vesicula TaxID=447962 RepID=A0AAD5U4R1_9FUNG|nr:hypothetical protein HK099_002049 [Clydaea vesicula]KAJ3391276.1 hypothetical protein HDU92_009136 [Lobulomyces angularis]
MSPENIEIGIIGGSGLYHLDNLTIERKVNPETPWGFPSDEIIIARASSGVKVAFLARHGKGHFLNPSEVPSKANIAALKFLGCKVILAFSAVGSLREEIAPTHFAIPNQIIDRTKGIRPSTYFESGLVAHTSFADPFDNNLIDLVYDLRNDFPNITFHKNKTLVCMEGPAFSTRAESNMYRSFGGDLINMSVVPEAKLAKEAEIAYCMVCMSTDYDAWRENSEGVNVEEVMKTMKTNSENARLLLATLIDKVHFSLNDKEGTVNLNSLVGSNRYSCVTDKSKRDPELVKKLDYILPGYF